MAPYENKTYFGVIKMFNGTFGFIKSELGDTYFHKSVISHSNVIKENDTVQFQVEPSTRKAGNFQAIKVLLSNKLEQVKRDESKLIIGILKWFDFEQGYGVICTPEKQDYFLHKNNNLQTAQRAIGLGTVLVFEETTFHNKKSALNCRLAENYGDWKLAFDYLLKNDIIEIGVKTIIENSNGRRVRSSKLKQFSLIYYSSVQILKTKEKVEQLKYISNYFESEIKEKSSEEHLMYFNYLLKIFNAIYDGNDILTTFFAQYSSYIPHNKELNYVLWVAGYTKEKNLNYIIFKIFEEPLESLPGLYKRLFSQLQAASEQSAILNDLLSKVEKIDTIEQYDRIKSLIMLSELDEKVKVDFQIEVFKHCDQERKIQMWLDGFALEKDFSFIAQKLLDEDFRAYSNPFRQIFSRLPIASEQTIVLKEFLSKIEKIDTIEQYNRIKSLIMLSELDEKVKADFQIEAFKYCDQERKFQMWLDGFAQEKVFSFIAQKLLDEDFRAYSNPFRQIFSRLQIASEQAIVLKEFLSKVEKIDTIEQYNRIKSLIMLSELDEKVKADFQIEAFKYCDQERKFQLWLDSFALEKDFSFIAQKLLDEDFRAYSNPFRQIFSRLPIASEQAIVLKEFLSKVEKIDTIEQYNRIKSLIMLSELGETVKANFQIEVFKHCDQERKFQLWLDGFAQEKDFSFIAQKLIDEDFRAYSNPFRQIFSRLQIVSEQAIVLKEFLSKIEKIDTIEQYNRIKSLIMLSELDEKAKADFQIEAFKYCDQERKFQLWLDDFAQEKDFSFIAQKLIDEDFRAYSNPFRQIFRRLQITSEQAIVLKEFLSKIKKIDTIEQYNKIKSLINLSELDEKVKADFQIEAFKYCDQERKFQLWLDGFAEEKDFNFITQKLIDEDFRIYPNPIRQIFSRLKASEQAILLKEFLLNVSTISTSEYNKIKAIIGLGEVDKQIKTNFVIDVYKDCDTKFKIELFIAFLWKTVDSNNILLKLLHDLDRVDFFHFCIRILHPLSYINNNYFYKGYSYLKIFMADQEYIRKTNIKYGKESIFNYQGILLSAPHFQRKLDHFKIVLSYLEENNESILYEVKEIISKGDTEYIMKTLEVINRYNADQAQICSDLGIPEPNYFSNLAPYIIKEKRTDQLLKFWVSGLIDYFDFNTYSFYYFTLTLAERKIFNKKAKLIMSEEIKSSMLKKREPWQLVEERILDGKIETEYSASWKSIWFGEGNIRICMDATPNFSNPFKWDFSEEKFNFLYEYISGRKLKDLKIKAYGDDINSIEGLEILQELIWKIQIQREVGNGEVDTSRSLGQNRIPVNMILRNKCLQFLNNLQLKEFEPVRIIEKTFNPVKNGGWIDISLLYSVPINEYEVAIIWESLELEKSKATHIFKCIRHEYENLFSEIKLYLSEKINVRSSLNSSTPEDINNQIKLRYLCRIDHDNFNFNKWETALLQALPELKNYI